MREDTTEIAQPLDRAWTIRTDGIRVPAPMREDPTGNDQTLDRAWTTPKRCVANVVPAPRLELGTGHDNVANLRCIISAALEEIERGQTRHAKSILITLKEVMS